MEALHVGGGRPRPSSHAQASAYTSHTPSLASAPAPGGAPDGDGGPDMRGMDSNLGALCEHVQLEGWKSRAFSDIVVKAMGHTFHLHRLLLSRSSYFRSVDPSSSLVTVIRKSHMYSSNQPWRRYRSEFTDTYFV